jgi:type I restriction enzyme, R subunit
MSKVGEIEKKTQARVVALFRDRLHYDYLGNHSGRDNSNIEAQLLTAWLEKQGVSANLISRVLLELTKAATDTSKRLYDRNKAVYELLRYGVKVQPGTGENKVTVWLIDWKHPDNNHFAIAEEVTIQGAAMSSATNAQTRANTKRPDIVMYVNGIALGVLELKRSTVSVAEGISQNLDNQKKEFIQPFFSTLQWVMAGNDTEGLRYATIETKAKYFLRWVEDSGAHVTEANLLDRHLLQVCSKARWLELMHDFVVFDAGTKKLCRQNQYFGVKAAQNFVQRREGGIIWHTQGSGKSLTMVWLAKWIRENCPSARVLIVTDRTELDEQIEKVFFGVNEQIYRTKSGGDLVAKLSDITESLMCSLVHKFGGKQHDESAGKKQAADSGKAFVDAIKKLPPGFKAKGDVFVFVDECHRTQTGDLHRAMKALLPTALFIGFTGTPLLKADEQKSIEVFGSYIHTYKFDQAVREGVVLDLRYEARDIDQRLTNKDKIDQWFEGKTQGLNDVARAQLKQKWGTMQRVLSSQDRLEKIAQDILLDMVTRPRLMDGHGNAMLVAGSIYEACKFYELFSKTDLKGKCAIVTSYAPTLADTKGESTGDGETDNLLKYAVYGQMLADWFDEPADQAARKAEQFEEEVKRRFINEPGQMKLLIVVDKLLTGFDAPPATYLYIDKHMRDHGLFQAICRVNRLDGEGKDYGYIIDYKDLFKKLEGAVTDYTSGALDGFNKEDVAGLLENRLDRAREDLEDAREAIKALCELVKPPPDQAAFLHYFCAEESGNGEQLKANEPKRLMLYKLAGALVRAYAAIANELAQAGYTASEIVTIKSEVDSFAKLRDEVRLTSSDYINLKAYEPAMRHLIDTYIRAEDSEKISAFDDLSLIELIVERGPEFAAAKIKGVMKTEEAVAETIENNVRQRIINKTPVDPAYFDKMSKLLDALIELRRKGALSYKAYLSKIAALTKDITQPGGAQASYPANIRTAAQRALFNNLGQDEAIALKLDGAIHANRQDDWRDNLLKTRKLRQAIRWALDTVIPASLGVQARETGAAPAPADLDAETDRILDIARHQHEY